MPVTLPRARFMVDQDGRLTVTVDGQPWQPPAHADDAAPARATVPLGRSDVLWAKQQIANELDTPVLVEVVDDGRPYNDVVDPDSYPTSEPGDPDDRFDDDRPDAGSRAGRYAPGEPVVITAVVGRTHADEDGLVHFRQPAALSNRTLLVHGQTSGTTLPLVQPPPPDRQPGLNATHAPNSAAVTSSAQAPFTGRDHDGRRPGARTAAAPTKPMPTTPDAPDAGWEAL